MYKFMNVLYFSLEITVESFLGLYFCYLCHILCRHRRQPATPRYGRLEAETASPVPCFWDSRKT